MYSRLNQHNSTPNAALTRPSTAQSREQYTVNVTHGNGVASRRVYGKGRVAHSEFSGVTFHRHARRWYSYMDAIDADGNRRRKHLGCHPPTRAGELEAAHWRDDMLKRHGVFAGLNFPNE
jgi:hypothetical protein